MKRKRLLRIYVITALAAGAFVCGEARADDVAPEPTKRTDATFRLFRTRNIFNFLELDTRNGRVWQVQWSTDAGRMVVPINTVTFIDNGKPGRYTLCPTENIFNFLLIDQEDGRVWQVQWSTNPKERLVFFLDDSMLIDYSELFGHTLTEKGPK